MPDSYTILLALVSGLVPALFWLWFWVREDRRSPEPSRLILLTFLCGMFAVPLVVPIQKVAHEWFSGTTLMFIVWAAVEELFKFGAAYVAVLTKKDVDEPIDVVIYMIAAALGFSALENALFVFNPLLDGDFAASLITGNLRFIGASLLHVVSSAAIGIFLAYSFYKPAARKKALLIGLLTATTLHTLFNLSIMNASSGASVMTLYAVWLGIIVMMLFMEDIKNRVTRKPRSTRNIPNPYA